jgi:hypothetical protein
MEDEMENMAVNPVYNNNKRCVINVIYNKCDVWYKRSYVLLVCIL